MKTKRHGKHHPWFHRSLFRLKHGHLHTAFLVESLVTTTIITMVFIFDDFFKQYVERQHISVRMKYFLHTLATFVGVWTVLYAFLFLFGYGQVIIS